MKDKTSLAGYAMLVLGHVAAVAAIGMGVTLIIMPLDHAQGIASLMQDVPRLWEMSNLAIALHFGLSACIWALVCIVYQLAQIRISERRENRAAIRLSRGSVMTETLVVMPIFVLLTFGMGQLAVNNIAGILANVASYEAARAAWIWQPEEDVSQKRMGVAPGIAETKCRVAVALVMMPVAPGDYIINSSLGSPYADKARMMVLGANVPFLGVLTTLAPAEAVSAFESGVAVGAAAGDIAKFKGSYADALDGSSFWLRSIRKFTAAYQSAECDIQDDHSVNLIYNHHVAMPVIDRIFGEFQLNGPGNRPGWYTTFDRSFGFKKQVNVPNAALPNNTWTDAPSYDENEFDPEGECTGDCP